jgi:hypothetical protein
MVIGGFRIYIKRNTEKGLTGTVFGKIDLNTIAIPYYRVCLTVKFTVHALLKLVTFPIDIGDHPYGYILLPALADFFKLKLVIDEGGTAGAEENDDAGQ